MSIGNETDEVQRALTRAKGNLNVAARLLGMSVWGLRRRLAVSQAQCNPVKRSGSRSLPETARGSR